MGSQVSHGRVVARGGVTIAWASAAVFVAGCLTSGEKTSGAKTAAPAPLIAAAAATTSVAAAPTTSASPTPVTTPPSDADASDAVLVARLRVAPEVDPGGYDRGLFGYPAGGTDSRGCNTRARVLQRDSLDPPQVTYPGCRVLEGRWVDAYDGTTYLRAEQVSIDHVVALKEAWRSGAGTWSAARLVAFGNDLDHRDALAVVGGSGNAAKGDKDPAAWRPPDPARAKPFARGWITSKVAWDLAADPAEVAALRDLLGLPAAAVTPPGAARQGPPSEPPPTATSGTYYASCAQARSAGAAPLHRADPGYRSGLDGDGDGTACE